MTIGLVTGGNAVIKVSGKNMAYATGLSYQVDIGVIPAETMGKFGVVALEPVSYSVKGSFQILRYSEASKSTGTTDANLPGASTKGNSPSNWDSNGAAKQLNPKEIINSSAFDIEVFWKGKAGDDKVSTVSAPTESVTDPKDPNKTITIGGIDVKKIIKITSCRITDRSGGIDKRGLFTETFNFVGIVMQDNDGNQQANSSDASEI